MEIIENNEQQEEMRSGATTLEGELPMLVWLQGDEHYFEEFNLDAEKVMEMLGIKRSRLTQISGRELRVGRTKIGRYVRPIYRQKDVEEYLDWVTPTSSHKKSGDYIEEASSRLEQMAEFFVGQLNSHTVNWPEKFKTIAENFYHGHYELEEKSEARLAQIEQKVMELSASNVNFLKRKIEGVESSCRDLERKIDDFNPMMHGIEELLKQILSLSQEVKELRKANETSRQQRDLLAQEMKKSTKDMSDLKINFEDFYAEFKQAQKRDNDKQGVVYRRKETYAPYALRYREKVINVMDRENRLRFVFKGNQPPTQA